MSNIPCSYFNLKPELLNKVQIKAIVVHIQLLAFPKLLIKVFQNCEHPSSHASLFSLSGQATTGINNEVLYSPLLQQHLQEHGQIKGFS